MTANRFPCVAASSRTVSRANGKVCIVQTTTFLSPERALASSALLLPLTPLIVATTPFVRSKLSIASLNWPSMTFRSETTITVSNTFRSLTNYGYVEASFYNGTERHLGDVYVQFVIKGINGKERLSRKLRLWSTGGGSPFMGTTFQANCGCELFDGEKWYMWITEATWEE